jgi:hypothetical protein
MAEADVLSQELGLAVDQAGGEFVVIEHNSPQVEDGHGHGNLVQDGGHPFFLKRFCSKTHLSFSFAN